MQNNWQSIKNKMQINAQKMQVKLFFHSNYYYCCNLFGNNVEFNVLPAQRSILVHYSCAKNNNDAI